MGFNRFSWLLTARLVLIFTSLLVIGVLVFQPGYHAATILAIAITTVLGYELVRFVSRTNQELARFLDAARYADFGQRFQFGAVGAGFEGLGETFTHILDRFREDRAEHAQDTRHLKSLIEHVPVPLISIYGNDSIVLWNNAARRLFGSAHVTKTKDLAQFGDEFYEQISSIHTGQRVLVTFEVDDLRQQLAVSASEIAIDTQTERLISLQDIRSELDGVQLSAWQDLVRVLTHEIMNSITPVTSLAKTAVDLVDDVKSRVAGQADLVAGLQDARDAVETVARRSDGLMNFVSSYRQLTRPPPPIKSRFLVQALFTDVCRIAVQNWQDPKPDLEVRVLPEELDLYADRQQVEQILINLLQNAYYAVGERSPGHIMLTSRLNKRGHVVIEVADNGTGIPAEIGNRVFIPFFTTRREGSGVGLALSRQIMLAHNGTITFTNRESNKGTLFTLVF